MLKMMTLSNTPTDDRPASTEGKPLRSLLRTPELKQALKALGPGWQILTDGGLREAVRRHHLPHHVADGLIEAPQEPASFEL